MIIKMKFEKPKDEKNGWYSMAKNETNQHLDIFLYGVIGGYHVNAQRFLDELQSAGAVSTITVYLNTFGGSFYDGLPIYNTLKQHAAQVTVKVMGYALSMGSVIMLAGDRVEAAENSLIMIHRANATVRGDADDLQKAIDILMKHEAAIIPEYMRRLGIDAAAVGELLSAETWYTASEAKQAGLIDGVMGEVEIDKNSAGMTAESLNFVSEHFKNVPDELKAVEIKTEAPQVTQAVGAVNVSEIAAEVVKLLKPDPSSEVEQLKQTCEALREEVAALSRPDPTKNTPKPENTGSEDDFDEDWYKDLKAFV